MVFDIRDRPFGAGVGLYPELEFPEVAPPERAPPPKPKRVESEKVAVQAILKGTIDSSLVPAILTFIKTKAIEVPVGSTEAFEKAIEIALEIKQKAEFPDTPAIYSQKLAQDIRNLEVDKPYIFLGNLKKSHYIPEFWERIIPPEAMKWLKSSDSFVTELEKVFLEATGGIPAIKSAINMQEILLGGMRGVQDRMHKLLPESVYKAVAKSLKLDFDELTSDKLKGTVWEKIGLKLLDGECEEELQKTLKAAFEGIHTQLMTQIAKQVRKSASFIPPSLKPAFEVCGLPTLGNPEFWIEIRKKSNGLYYVRLHADDALLSLPIKLPIEFSDVSLSSLRSGFWTPLLRFLIWPEKGTPCDFAITDLYETLVKLLGSQGKALTPEINAHTTWEMVCSFLEIDDTLSATLAEIEPETLAPKPLIQLPTDKMAIPPLLFQLASEMMPNASELETVREILRAILGKDADACTDDFIKELSSEIGNSRKPKPPITLPKTFSEIFGLDLLTDLKKMRFSLLHSFKLSAKIASFVWALLAWTASIEFLSSYFMMAFPGINLILSAPVKYVCALALMYGAEAIKPYVPAYLIDKVMKFFAFYYKIKGAVMYQIQIVLLRVAARHLMDKAYIKKLQDQINGWQARVTRSGELSFSVEPSKEPLELLPTPPRKPSAPVSPPQEIRALALPIDEYSIEHYLGEWIYRAKGIPNLHERLYFLNNCVRKLPLPNEDNGLMWQFKLSGRSDILQKLVLLSECFSTGALSTRYQRVELVVSMYSLYSIIRAIGGYNPNYSTNTQAFLEWLEMPGVRASTIRTLFKMRSLRANLQIDRPPLFTYTEEEIRKGNLPNAELELFCKNYEEAIDFFTKPDHNPYHYVRTVHHNALRALSDRSLQTSPLRRFNFTWVNKSTPGPLLGRMHWLTKYALRNIKIIPNQPLPPLDGHVSDYGKLDVGNPYDNLSKKSYDLPYKSTRSQAEIVLGKPREIEHLRPEICNLLEMIDQYPEHQIVRVVSLFSSKPFLLNDRRCMHLFETLLLDQTAIMWVKFIREEAVLDVLEELLAVCKKLLIAEEFAAALFVAKVSNDLKLIGGNRGPNFRQLIREEFPKTPLVKVTLVSMYLEPINATQEEILDAIHHSLSDPCRKQEPGFEDVQIRANEVIWEHMGSGALVFPVIEEAPVPIANPDRKIDLTSDKHGLHLLEWFQPLSSIDAYEKDGEVTTILFKTLGLEFQSKKDEEGRIKVFGKNSHLTAFFISPLQKIKALHSIANYLLLCSEEGERKVILPVYSAKILFGKFLSGQVEGSTSPFLEKLFCNYEQPAKYYTYECNDDCVLGSDNPEALSYLATIYLAKGEVEKASLLLLNLKRLGNLKEFSKETITYIEKALAFLALSKEKKTRLILLKLIAISEENRKVQSERPLSLDPKFTTAAWGFALKTYHSYLKNEESYLSDIEELFILKYIHANCPVPESLSQFKAFLPQILMPKICAERYLLLRNMYGRDANSWKIVGEMAILHSLFGESRRVSLVPNLTEDPSIQLKLLERLTNLSDHPLVRAKSTSLSETFAFNLEEVMESAPLDLFSLTQDNIEKHFKSYYVIIFEKAAPQYEKLCKSLALLQGRFPNKNSQMLLYILQNVAKMADPKGFLPCIEELIDREDSKKQLIASVAGVDGIYSMLESFRDFDFSKAILPLAKKTVKVAIAETVRPIERALWLGRSVIGYGQAFRRLRNLRSGAICEAALNWKLEGAPLEEFTAKELEIDALLGLNGGELIDLDPTELPFSYAYDLETKLSVRTAYDQLNLSIAEEFQRACFIPIGAPRLIDREKIESELEEEKVKLETDMCLPFKEIQALFLRGETAAFDKQIYLYLIKKSRMNAFFARNAIKRAYNFFDLTEMQLRVFLIFEMNANTLIWQKQLGPLILLIGSTDMRIVSEMIMGLGKTDALMPIANFLDADGSKLVINIRPAPNAKTATAKSAHRSHMLFDQFTSTIPLSRNGWSAERLEALYLKLMGMKKEKELWDGTKEELQSLELRFLEEALDITGKFAREGKEELQARLYYFQKILQIIRTDGKAHIDEAHEQFKESKKLHFPIGEPHVLEEKHAQILKDAILALRELVNLRSEAPISISKETYYREIFPILEGKLGGDPLTGGALKTLFPSILEEITHTSYAASKKADEEFAKPADGNENPDELSSFQNHFSAFIKTAFLLIHDRLNQRQLNAFIDHLKKQARIELKGKIRTPENLNLTPSAKDFAKYCKGYKLFSFEPKDKDDVLKLINDSDDAVLDYAIKVIRPQIKFFQQSLSSNAHNFASMFSKFAGYTASPYNKGTYPEDTTVIHDKGTQGETARLLHDRDPACYALAESSPLSALDEILRTMLPNLNAIIDRGALFNGLSNEVVAEKILHYITENALDFKGVVFYTSAKELVIWEKGCQTWAPLSSSKIPLEKRITYFDQSHTYASDIPQAENARAIVTVGETIILEDLFQAIWRMRGLKTRNQTVEFAMTERTAGLISGTDPLNSEAIIRFALKNQALQSEESNYFSDLSALRNVVRREILDRALAAETVPNMVAILKNCQHLFISEYSGDPDDFFGDEETLIPPEEMFLKVMTGLLRGCESSGLFDEKEVDDIRDRLYKIPVNKPYPALVSSVHLTQTNAIEQNVLGEEARIEVTEEEEEELELTHSLQQQLQLTLNRRVPIKHKVWPLEIDLTETSRVTPVLESTPFQIFSMRDILNSHTLSAAKELAHHIDPRIAATNNLMLDPHNAFDEYQIPIQDVLILKDEPTGEILKCILLSARESASFRCGQIPELSPHNQILLEINTQCILGISPYPHLFTKAHLKDHEIQFLLLQIRILRGDSDFTLSEKDLLKPWLAKVPLATLKTYAELPHKTHTYTASTLQHLLQKRARKPSPSTLTGAGTASGSSANLTPYTLYRS